MSRPRGGYLVCAVVVVGDLSAVRSSVRTLPRRGSSRVHMVDESPRQRRLVLAAVTALPVEAHLVSASLTGRSQRRARDLCLAGLVETLTAAGVDQLVLESCDQDRQDRVALARAVRDLDPPAALEYVHRRPREETLLWLPDVIAWAYGWGGEWRTRAAGVIRSVQDCP